MRKKLVYICSPLRGDMEKNIAKAQEYCREATMIWPDVVPIAPHVYCTQFLDDTKPDERAVGLNIGLSLLDMCDELWVYGIDNPSEGMRGEIEYANANGIPVRDANEVYKYHRENAGEREEVPELGDAILTLPGSVTDCNGVAVVNTTALHIGGEIILQLAQQLRRNPGHDIELEAAP